MALLGRHAVAKASAISAVLLITIIGLIVLASNGDSGTPKTSGAATSPEQDRVSKGSDGNDVQPAAGRRQTADERAGLNVVRKIYDKLGKASKQWFVRADANVRSGMSSARSDPSLTALCNLMSSPARTQTIDYARATARINGVKWNCENSVALLIRRSNVQGMTRKTLRARPIGMSIDGRRGVATIDFGRGPTTTVRLVKQGGQWKLGDIPG